MPGSCNPWFVARRPLIGIAGCLMLGIGLGAQANEIPTLALLLAAAVSLALSFVGGWKARRLPGIPRGLQDSPAPGVLRFSAWPRLLAGIRYPDAVSLIFLYLAIVLAAWSAVTLKMHNPSGRELAALMDRPREGVELVGIITDDPHGRPTRDGTARIWSFPVRVEAIRRLPAWQTARGTVRVTLRALPGSRPPGYGERWRLAGALFNNARFPERRSAREWAKVPYAFRADPAASVRLAGDQGVWLMAQCFRARRRAGECLARGIGHRPEVVGLLTALLLGYRQELPDKLRRDFIATGTYHIFAISGQHVAILAMFIIVVLQANRVGRVTWFLYVAPLLILFTLATGLSTSAVRGCLMALLVFLGPLLGRKPDLPSAMALAAILILAVDPFQLFDYGFLLSFGVVAGLILLCPPLLKLVEPWLAPDPWQSGPERPAVQFGRKLARFAALLMVSSAAAWLVSTPLIARWFNQVSPIALLANLVVLPVSALVMLAGCLSVLCGLCLPWLGEVFNFANVALVSFLLFVTDRLARIPWGHFFVASPPIWLMLAWFGTLLAWIPGWKLGRFRAAGLAFLVAVVLGHVVLEWNRPSLDIFNLGGVPVGLVKAPRTAPLLIHAGSRFNGSRAAQRLQRQGVNRLAALVLPASDERHSGGASNILSAFRVGELWCATTNARSPVFRRVLDGARARGVPIRVLADCAGNAGRGGAGWHGQVVSNEFIFRRAGTVLTIGWGASGSGRDVFETVTVEGRSPAGRPFFRRIRCVPPGESAAERGANGGDSWIGLAPGQDWRLTPVE